MVVIKNRAVLPDCPYCGARLGYLQSFVVKNRSLYKCKSCGKKSCVDLKYVFYNVLSVVAVICVVIFAFSLAAGGGFVLFGLAVILLVFLGFYSVTPYMVILKRATEKQEKKKKFQKTKKIKQTKDVLHDVKTENAGDFEKDKDIFSN